jgi:hypothetical protein
LHTRHASRRSRRTTPRVAHRPVSDDRQLLAERAWKRRSVLGGLRGFTLAAELMVGIA